MAGMVTCPCCNGDGKETCHNPDHGFINAMGFHDIGRLGCPVCGSHPKHKVGSKRDGGSAPCDVCIGSGEVSDVAAREFCGGMGYDYDEVMEIDSEAAP